jgi:hypothetical protein
MTYRDISDIFRKALYAGIGLGLALALTACGRSANQSLTSGPTSSPTATQASTRPSDSPSASTSNDALPGFGATLSAGNAHHTADTRFASNAAYNPDSTLPSYSGQDVYVAVQWQDPEGDVFVEFETLLPDGSSIYKSTDVNGILVGLGSYPTAASGPAC